MTVAMCPWCDQGFIGPFRYGALLEFFRHV
jgi:hypothetical protein